MFALEQERIFSRLWIYVAHESQLKKPGDFVRTRLAASRGPGHPAQRRKNLRPAEPLPAPWRANLHGGSGQQPAVQLSLSCLGVPARRLAVDGSTPQELSGELQLSTIRGNHMQRIEQRRRPIAALFSPRSIRNPDPLVDHLGPMTDVIDNLIDRAPDGEIEIADSSFTLEYRGNWKLHLENAADIFHPSFVHSSSVMPARRAPANASILDQDQTREMLLANGFGTTEWETHPAHRPCRRPHLHDQFLQQRRARPTRPPIPLPPRYQAALVAQARAGTRRERARHEPVQQYHLSQSHHQRAISADARHHPDLGRPDDRAGPLFPPARARRTRCFTARCASSPRSARRPR